MTTGGYVLLGDIVSSKKINDRAKFQKKLIKVCNITNQNYENDLIAKMKIIKGSDEIGCLLRSISPLYNIIDEISADLYPIKIRFVLVYGKIDTGFATYDISQMDGPAFHLASRLMDDLKRDKLIFNMSTSNKILDTLISNNINLIYILKEKWSPTKIEIIRAYERWGEQRKVANELGISQQTVSYHFKSSKWKEIKKMETELKLSLESLGSA